MARTSLALPDFPWDSLAPYAERARLHPLGLIDLSVGSPVDPTPPVIQDALAAASNAHSYPLTAGSPAVREAIVAWFGRRRGVSDLSVANVMPTIGSKELVALMPLLLGLGPGDVVVHPEIAYPTYAIGAALVGARAVAVDDPTQWPVETRLVWLNSPGNPNGRTLDRGALRSAVLRARELGAVIVNDECYAEFNWTTEEATPSILDPGVIDGDRDSVLALYSLSKQSNLAGYRAGFVAGCSDLIDELLAARKHIGLIPPAPVQQAMISALADDAHVAEQRERYRRRRARLIPAVEAAGYRVEESAAGLYLWLIATGPTAVEGRAENESVAGRAENESVAGRAENESVAVAGLAEDEGSWRSVAEFASRGILVAPGTFYGEKPARHVRLALTASDAAIADAVVRLGSFAGR